VVQNIAKKGRQRKEKHRRLIYFPPAATCSFARDATIGTARNAYATHANVNPLPTDATRSGASEPDCRRAMLKSSTDLPNQMRRMRKDVKPVMNPKTPNHATPLWKVGLSRRAPIFPGSFDRKDRRVKRTTKNVLRTKEIAMKAGVAEVGAERRRFGASLGRTDKSYTGSSTVDVQLRGASLFGREQDPSAPKRTVGPSIFEEPPPGCFSDVDGVTESKET